jgi:hypothetical protein
LAVYTRGHVIVRVPVCVTVLVDVSRTVVVSSSEEDEKGDGVATTTGTADTDVDDGLNSRCLVIYRVLVLLLVSVGVGTLCVDTSLCSTLTLVLSTSRSVSSSNVVLKSTVTIVSVTYDLVVCTTSVPGPDSVVSSSTARDVVDVDVTTTTSHTSRYRWHVLRPASGVSSVQILTSTDDGTPPAVSACHGASQYVTRRCSVGAAVMVTGLADPLLSLSPPLIEAQTVDGAGVTIEKPFSELKLTSCSHSVTVTLLAKPVIVVAHTVVGAAL